jgi:hydroxymethylglutaryl-CoA lyase
MKLATICRRFRLSVPPLGRAKEAIGVNDCLSRPMGTLCSSDVRVVEVGPRDGLQNEPRVPDAHGKVELIRKLHEAGCRHIEVGSLVSPKWVPSMADTEQVLQGLREWLQSTSAHTDDSNRFSVLVPNKQGLLKAMNHRDVVDEVAVFASASESFSQRNIACSIDESFERFQAVVATARDADFEARRPLLIRGYVSCVIACPYQGSVSPADVARVVGRLGDLGCYEVSLGDTIGVGTPASVREMLREVQPAVSGSNVNLAVHFHDTYGQALSNILVSLEDAGVSTVDSALAGLGGCPYAKGASGNVATEGKDGAAVKDAKHTDPLTNALIFPR